MDIEVNVTKIGPMDHDDERSRGYTDGLRGRWRPNRTVGDARQAAYRESWIVGREETAALEGDFEDAVSREREFADA